MGRTFHQFERKMQQAAGLSVDEIEATRGPLIRSYMPEQHQDFFSKLTLLWLSLRDKQGCPMVLALSGPEGFIKIPSENELLIMPHQVIDPGLFYKGQQVGLLGMELHSRRRNRVNCVIEHAEGQALRLKVGHSFGNCPKYIQVRHLAVGRDLEPVPASARPEQGSGSLPADKAVLVSKSDTFFIATYTDFAEDGVELGAIGCDISHRGGPPGFVQLHQSPSGTSLTWPDYIGNNFFNTLGNILANGQAALMFIDFVSGDLLHLQGHARVDLKDRSLPGAQRSIHFQLEAWTWQAAGLPMRASEEVEYSPYNPTPDANSSFVRCMKIEQAARGIKTFTFSRPESSNGRIPLQPLRYKPGQFGSFNFEGLEEKVTNRTWTISSHPFETMQSGSFSITVKRDGLVSNWLHDHLEEGQKVSWSGVDGSFIPEPSTSHALLIAGGIGITPMRAMFHEFRRKGTPTTLLYSVRHSSEAAFASELQRAAEASSGRIQVHLTVTGKDDGWSGAKGRIDAPLISKLVPDVGACTAYMCGPEAFMEGVKKSLASLGLPPARILTESFNF